MKTHFKTAHGPKKPKKPCPLCGKLIGSHYQQALTQHQAGERCKKIAAEKRAAKK